MEHMFNTLIKLVEGRGTWMKIMFGISLLQGHTSMTMKKKKNMMILVKQGLLCYNRISYLFYTKDIIKLGWSQVILLLLLGVELKENTETNLLKVLRGETRIDFHLFDLNV